MSLCFLFSFFSFSMCFHTSLTCHRLSSVFSAGAAYVEGFSSSFH
jgi:hypothetical protein